VRAQRGVKINFGHAAIIHRVSGTRHGLHFTVRVFLTHTAEVPKG
jgi:hypothetical protein